MSFFPSRFKHEYIFTLSQPFSFLEGEDFDVHNIANDSKDFYPKFIDLVVHCNVLLLVSALPIIGPPINAFPKTARHANAHLIIVPPTSSFLALLFSTIDLAIVATNDSCVIIDDEYVLHKVLPKSWFLEMNEKELEC